MGALVKKVIGQDVKTGLNIECQIWQIVIDSKAEMINVVYDLVLLAPNGEIATVLKTDHFVRLNQPAILDKDGNTIKLANLRFNDLRVSPIGQAIIGMLTTDINLVQTVTSIVTDLEQKQQTP